MDRMDPATLEAFMAQLGLPPLGAQPPNTTPPGTPGATFLPYDTSAKPGTSFGQPYPQGPPPVQPSPDPAATGAPAGGFTPQPRPELPRPLTHGPGSDIFSGYGGVWDPPADAQDPIAALLGAPPTGPGFPPQTPPSRALAPQWAQQGAGNPPSYGVGQAQLDRHAQNVMPTESERALLRQSDAYARTINKIHALDRLRSAKGF